MFTVLLVSLFISAGVFSQGQPKNTKLPDLPVGTRTDEGAKVPELVKLKFDKVYPDHIAAWTIEDKHFMAEYKDSVHLGHIVTLDQYGEILSVQNELTPGTFPAPIDEYIVKHYPNQKFTIWSMNNSDGTKLYYFTRKPETVWFDPTGAYRNTTVNKTK